MTTFWKSSMKSVSSAAIKLKKHKRLDHISHNPLHMIETNETGAGMEIMPAQYKRADARLSSYAGHQPFSCPVISTGENLIILQIT